MAKESQFLTDKKKGNRDEERLVRNRRAITGEDEQTARKNISDQIRTSKDETPPNDGPGFDNNGPTGKDDGADDDSSGDGQKQSARLPDPGDDTGNETKDVTPAQKNRLEDFDKSDGPRYDILATEPSDLTVGEVGE